MKCELGFLRARSTMARVRLVGLNVDTLKLTRELALSCLYFRGSVESLDGVGIGR